MEDILFLCSAQEEIERNFRQENYKIIWVISIFHGSFKNIITWKLFKNQRIFLKIEDEMSGLMVLEFVLNF